MFSWIAENFAAFMVCVVLAGVVIAALTVTIRNKVKKKSSCGCNCSACAMRGSCQGNH